MKIMKKTKKKYKVLPISQLIPLCKSYIYKKKLTSPLLLLHTVCIMYFILNKNYPYLYP